MSDTLHPLDMWRRQVDEYLASDAFTARQKRRLLSFNAGACWGYAMATSDSADRLKGFRFREEISAIGDSLQDWEPGE